MTAPGKLTIDTPEQIGVEFTLAGVGSRFLALLVDTLIQLAAMLVLSAGSFGLAMIPAMRGADAFLIVLAVTIFADFVIFYGYFAAFEALWQGQTPGKRIVGLRVISASGRPIDVYQAIVRNLLRIVDSLPGYGVGIVSIFATRLHQRIGDLAAGTVVVLETPVTASPELALPRRAALVGAARLTDAEVSLIEAFLSRREDLDWFARERTAGDIAARVRRRLELPRGGSDEELLERVLAEVRGGDSYG